MPGQYGVFPLEPDDDMLIAGQEAWAILDRQHAAIDDCPHAAAVWKAMTATAPTQVSLADHIQALADKMTRGSVRDLAYRLGVNETYLKRLREGSQASPSEEVIERLGLQRITTYVRKP